jgi:dipeptidyl aminopeptidase/acylaminoacyl peptidase
MRQAITAEMRGFSAHVTASVTLLLAVVGPISPLRAQTPKPAPAAASSSQASPKESAFRAEDALDIVTYAVQDLSSDGRWLAATSQVRRDGFGVDYRRDGDPTYVRTPSQRVWVIDTERGEQQAIFPDKRNVRGMRWSPDGSRLGMLVFDPRSQSYEPAIWERSGGRLTTVKVPSGKYVAENSDLRWTSDGSKLAFALHTLAWRKAVQDSFEVMTKGPVFVQSSKDSFLTWEALRRTANVRSIAAYDLKSRQTNELLPEAMMSNWDLTEDGALVTYSEDITKKTDYDVIFGSESKLMARQLADGKTRTVLPTLKGLSLVWSEDGTRYAYGKEGRVYVATLNDTAAKQVAGAPEAKRDTPPDTTKEARERRDRERFTPVRYSPTNDALLVSSREGLWLLDVATGSKDLVVATSDSDLALPRVSTAAWTRDGKQIYFTFASRTKWERGVLRYDRSTKKMEELARGRRSYAGLRLSKDGKVAVLSIAEGNRPAELFVGDARLQGLRRLVDANPQLRAKQFGSTDLLSYLDADGHQKYGVIYYPTGYERGKTYPTVFNIYEDFFDDGFDPTASVLAANGYVVVKPSVDFDIGFPGEAWIKGVTAAANKLIEMGIADSARLGVHGTSYGGYATNLLITQTNRFKAAINISGKVDIISFYTDSPRLGVRNVHAAEKSQDRLGATLWQQPQKYVQHSAIMFADRIQTPLMLMTGAQDSNVPADNTREMYYALRRLGKEVVWVNYMNGGHGGGNATVEDFLDMQRRMLAWYDAKLKRPVGKVAARP